MKKMRILVCFVHMGLVSAVYAQDTSLVKKLLTEEETLFDRLPVEIKWELGERLLEGHSVLAFLMDTLSKKSEDMGIESLSYEYDQATLRVIKQAQGNEIWDRSMSRRLLFLPGHGVIEEASISPRGDKIVVAYGDRTAQIWDLASGQCVQTLVGHSAGLNTASFNRSGDKVVTTCFDNVAKVWDVESGTCLVTLSGGFGWLFSARFAHEGESVLLVTGGECTKIRYYEIT